MLEELKQSIRVLADEISQPSDEPLNDETELLISGRLDSMGVIRLATEIETYSGLEVPPIDITIENFENLSAIFRYIAGRTNAS